MNNGPINSRHVAMLNRSAVLREVLLSGPLSRTEIAHNIGLTAGAVSRILQPTIDAGLVLERPDERENVPVRPGPRFVLLEVNPQGGQVLGLGISPSYQTVALADLKGNVIASGELELDTIEDPERVVRQVARVSRKMIGSHLKDRGRLLGGLLMITAPVDPVRGDILGAPYLGWDRFPLKARLAELLNLPMKVQSMTATIALAETLFGATRGRSDVLTLLCGLGIGAAIILDGRLISGGSVPMGGIGGLEMTAEDGTAATLDQLGSGLGVLQRLHGDDKVVARMSLHWKKRALLTAIDREKIGDSAAGETMARAGRELGRAIVEFTRYITPESVLIAGPLALSPGYIGAAREAVSEGMRRRAAEVVTSSVAGSGSVHSASCAMAVVEYLLERPLDLSRLGV